MSKSKNESIEKDSKDIEEKMANEKPIEEQPQKEKKMMLKEQFRVVNGGNDMFYHSGSLYGEKSIPGHLKKYFNYYIK